MRVLLFDETNPLELPGSSLERGGRGGGLSPRSGCVLSPKEELNRHKKNNDTKPFEWCETMT